MHLAHLYYLLQMEKRGPLDTPMKRRNLENDDRENISVDSGVMGQPFKKKETLAMLENMTAPIFS